MEKRGGKRAGNQNKTVPEAIEFQLKREGNNV